MSQKRPNRVHGGRHDEFWARCAEGELHVQRCGSCGELAWPVVDACELCGSQDLAFERMSGKGRLISWCTFERDYYRGVLPLPWPVILVELEALPPDPDPRAIVRRASRVFFDFSVANPARYQLMIQRTIPGFEPSAESYAPAVRTLEHSRRLMNEIGVTDPDDFDIWISLLGGLVNQQLANDPGGTRWSALLDRAVDFWADGVGLPPSPVDQKAAPRRRSRTARSNG